jgi:hypothetical protein
MMLKTFNITLGALVAFSVWCAAVMFTVFTVVIGLHVLVIGGMTAYYLTHH